MAFTETDLSTLETALREGFALAGVKRLTVGGKTTEFRSVSELREYYEFVQQVVHGSAENRVTKASLRNRP